MEHIKPSQVFEQRSKDCFIGLQSRTSHDIENKIPKLLEIRSSLTSKCDTFAFTSLKRISEKKIFTSTSLLSSENWSVKKHSVRMICSKDFEYRMFLQCKLWNGNMKSIHVEWARYPIYLSVLWHCIDPFSTHSEGSKSLPPKKLALKWHIGSRQSLGFSAGLNRLQFLSSFHHSLITSVRSFTRGSTWCNVFLWGFTEVCATVSGVRSPPPKDWWN